MRGASLLVKRVHGASPTGQAPLHPALVYSILFYYTLLCLALLYSTLFYYFTPFYYTHGQAPSPRGRDVWRLYQWPSMNLLNSILPHSSNGQAPLPAGQAPLYPALLYFTLLYSARLHSTQFHSTLPLYSILFYPWPSTLSSWKKCVAPLPKAKH